MGEGGETEGAGLDGVTWSGGGKRELSRDGGGGVGMLGEALIGGTSGHRGSLPVVLAQGLLWLLLALWSRGFVCCFFFGATLIRDRKWGE